MGRAIVRLTAEALFEALKFPPGTKLVCVKATEFEHFDGSVGPSVELIVEAEGLPVAGEGSSLSRVAPRYEEKFHTTVHFKEWL